MYRSNKSQIIYTISGLHMDRKRIGTHDLWMQLFLLQQGELRIYWSAGSACTDNDCDMRWKPFIYIIHVDECDVWAHDGDWND